MLLMRNPTNSGIIELCKKSSVNAAKWLKDTATGNMYYWPADQMRHAEFAEQLNITDYTSGISVPTES